MKYTNESTSGSWTWPLTHLTPTQKYFTFFETVLVIVGEKGVKYPGACRMWHLYMLGSMCYSFDAFKGQFLFKALQSSASFLGLFDTKYLA